MSNLALTFPSLQDAPGVVPWELERLDEWASVRPAGDSARYAARFVFAVFDGRGNWRSGPFDPIRAQGVWDAAHYEAFQA